MFFDHKQVLEVSSFSTLVSTQFQKENNAICWSRNLHGNFKEIVEKLELKEDITEVSREDLMGLSLSEEGNIAREIILADIQLLSDFGASPTLNLLKKYQRDEEFDFISTDVYSYHVDRSPIEVDTYLCTYYGPASDILPQDQAQQKISIPEIRAELKKIYDGPESEFDSFLKEFFFDLHYQAKPCAEPINLGIGNLWRLAVDHPTQQVSPCIHRAPTEMNAECRLLLIC